MKKTIILFAFLFALLCKAFAQIEGEVKDEKNNLLGNVVITLSDTAGKIVKTVKCDNKGFYSIDGLAPGKYIIEAKLTGFVTKIVKDIRITEPPKTADKNDDTYYAVCVDVFLARQKNKK